MQKEQGINSFENCELPVQEALIDYVLLTHAHIDHSGMIPRLAARGFRGQIFTTQASADLCSIMLRDCAHIQMQEAEWKNRKAKRSKGIEVSEPEYTMQDADAAIKRIVPCAYDELITLCEGIQIRFTDVGHLLGSASIEVWATEEDITKKIVFSGDRLHSSKHPDYVKELAAILQETFDRGGNVVIPSFAVGRTQEILYFLRKIKEDGLVKNHYNFPVYVDSPLAVEATGIFHKNENSCFDEEAMALVKKGINPISFPGLRLSITSDESKAINFETTPKVIISASGMCEAGRIRHHLKHNLWRPECTILFVGYQAVGTLGRVLIEGVQEVKLFGETIDVHASIKEKPRRVFIVHGEDSVCKSFAECLQVEYGIKAYAPYSGTEFNLITNKLEYEAVPIPVRKKTKTVSDVFARLRAAGHRLLAVIQKNEGSSNKDLARFADQINSLCDKWEI